MKGRKVIIETCDFPPPASSFSLMRIQPAKRLRGILRVPGDKSISHRAAIIAALAKGSSLIENFSTSEDCASTLDCLRRLGVSIEHDEAAVRVEGVGLDGLRAPSEALDCGNSGSTMRMLAGVLAGQSFTSVLTGDRSLRSRPMRRIIEPLERMGALISSEIERAPLRITGRNPLTPITYEMTVASAQVKSCILLAGLRACGRTEVIEKAGATRDHTERMLDWFGVPVETIRDGRGDGDASHKIIYIASPANLTARDFVIPGDISSAAFFIAAAACLPASHLEITGLGLNPTRTQILRSLQEMGADVSTSEVREQCNETVGSVCVRAGSTPFASVASERSNVLEGALIPQLIDELPMLAVVATQIEGGLRIRGATELRFKESDRIAATVANLRAMGASVKEYDDGLCVCGRTRLRGAVLDSYGDHRIAMAFTIAALIAEGETEIRGAECVGISFPEFFHLLDGVVER